MEDEKKLIIRDWLAIERTKLANERTFLSYFRTSLVLFATGLTLLKIEYFSDIKYLGLILLLIAPLVLLVGIVRLFQVKKGIQNHYK